MIFEIQGRTIVEIDGTLKTKSLKGLVIAEDIITAITSAEDELRSLCATAEKAVSIDAVKVLKAEYLNKKEFCGETVWCVHVADEENNKLCVYTTAEDTREAENIVQKAYMEYTNVVSVKKTNIIFIANN